MEKKQKVLETYNQLKNFIDIDNYSDFIIDEFLMFASIYLHYNFKDNGCPYYDINQLVTYFNDFKIVQFKPNYSLFLQDSYDMLFDSIFNYKIKSTKIRIEKLNIKMNINVIQIEIINNKTIQELINCICEYYNFKTFNLKIKKNNIELDETKKIIEYRLNETSKLTLNFNQFG